MKKRNQSNSLLLTLFILLGWDQDTKIGQSASNFHLRDENPVRYSHDTIRYSPFSSYFNNPYDYVDAESYSTSLFTTLYQHMNAVKREKHVCKTIPVPKTVLNKKYFNGEYEFLQHKYWFPPKEHQYVMLWAQYESYRNALFLSYMLQGDNARFPPGKSYIFYHLTFNGHFGSYLNFGFFRRCILFF